MHYKLPKLKIKKYLGSHCRLHITQYQILSKTFKLNFFLVLNYLKINGLIKLVNLLINLLIKLVKKFNYKVNLFPLRGKI